ncbi:MAG: CcmD family protein [Cytophagaceae bacterium]
MKKIISLFLLSIFSSVQLMAQVGNDVPMADKFREDGKIYVVILTFSIVLAGFFFYLISVDRKLSKFEKQKKES